VTFALAWICGLFGLVFGSFLNVVVYRVPQKISIVSPPSACPHCHHEIRRSDNVPVVSWIWLRGRCRDCAGPISIRYPLVEAATGALFAGAAVRLGEVWVLPAYCALLAGILALALIDLDTLTLPRSVVWVHLAIVATLLTGSTAITGHWRDLVVGALCGAAWSGLYLGLHLISPRAIGFGDVRLALVLGLSLGYLDLAYPGLGFLAANVVGVMVTGALITTKRIERSQPVPYGVFLAVGTAIAFFAGPDLTQYFRYEWWRVHI
jgi:leader peptidase (prepilin peptidase) / N-methyltransferase